MTLMSIVEQNYFTLLICFDKRKVPFSYFPFKFNTFSPLEFYSFPFEVYSFNFIISFSTHHVTFLTYCIFLHPHQSSTPFNHDTFHTLSPKIYTSKEFLWLKIAELQWSFDTFVLCYSYQLCRPTVSSAHMLWEEIENAILAKCNFILKFIVTLFFIVAPISFSFLNSISSLIESFIISFHYKIILIFYSLIHSSLFIHLVF